MVEITEIMPPAKVSGLSSFLVRFQFRQELVDALKTIPGAYYHKKLQVWEVPANQIAETLDILTFLDQVSINLYDYEQNVPEREYGASGGILLNENEINSFKVRPYDHQLDAINYGLAHPNFLLLDSMGLGKTNEII